MKKEDKDKLKEVLNLTKNMIKKFRFKYGSLKDCADLKYLPISYGGKSCKFCKGINQGYTLIDSIWAQINPDIEGLVCIKCAEERLGRKLKLSDFNLEAPINFGFLGFNCIDYIEKGEIKYRVVKNPFYKKIA